MPISKAQMKATKKYEKEHYDQINFKIAKGYKEKIKSRADSLGKSMQAYLQDLVKKDMGEE